ncbi:Flagellar basal-body rod protein FlgC [Rickettsiales endosymbiont of Paramecium tredecaurelia]|nr:Flagellar basal-body rod protein FlgC [Candidatus Sarmatiella mevalonica]
MRILLLAISFCIAYNVIAKSSREQESGERVDGLTAAMNVGINGMNLQSERLKVASENIANIDTPVTNGSDAYVRRVVVVQNKYNKRLGAHLISVKKINKSKSDRFRYRYDPNHPNANDDGYVVYPNIEREIEVTDATEAQRSYELNLAITDVAKNMIQKTIDSIK